MKLSWHERKAQGNAAEERFRCWLDRCHLPHIYVEQSPFTIPKPLRGTIKRPDFLVGVPTIGTIAVDVKSKRIYRDHFFLDVQEHRTLLAFETYFNISVWFASFAPDLPDTCHLFLNRAISEHSFKTAKGVEVISIPIMRTWRCDERRDFMAAVMSAISLRDKQEPHLDHAFQPATTTGGAAPLTPSAAPHKRSSAA